ncbi:N-6 DNA methylase [Streptomyces sp. NPDC005728]|uniref:N-6 DNA methylase n=1 Tax=Streptomyces sp. NPDC005728 TaxID=3157054 RepID=UPI0033D08AF1
MPKQRKHLAHMTADDQRRLITPTEPARLGTVAALALLRNVPGLADWILNLQPHELPQLFKEIYLGHWIKRPDLINRAIRLHDWAWNPQPDKQQLRAVHAVTHAAINTGLMDLTGHDDPYWRSESDVLSPLLTGLRHKSDKKWRGEYHTPPCVTDLMARILVDKDVGGENKSIGEPAVGSGTMFRSVVQRLRELQLNPHDYTWYGNDIDSLAAASASSTSSPRSQFPHDRRARPHTTPHHTPTTHLRPVLRRAQTHRRHTPSRPARPRPRRALDQRGHRYPQPHRQLHPPRRPPRGPAPATRRPDHPDVDHRRPRPAADPRSRHRRGAGPSTGRQRRPPGRSWHATLATRHTDLAAALASVLRDQLLPALTNQPKRVPTPEPKTEATGDKEPKAKRPAAKKTRTNPTKD